jgi:hypothetical protein
MALLFAADAIASGAPVSIVAVAPFAVAGVWMIFGRFIWKARRKRKTLYLLTDQRAIVLVGDRNMTETPWRGWAKQVSRHRDGRHIDVIFEWGTQGRGLRLADNGMNMSSVRPAMGFYDVADTEALLSAIGQSPL